MALGSQKLRNFFLNWLVISFKYFVSKPKIAYFRTNIKVTSHESWCSPTCKICKWLKVWEVWEDPLRVQAVKMEFCHYFPQELWLLITFYGINHQFKRFKISSNWPSTFLMLFCNLMMLKYLKLKFQHPKTPCVERWL